MVTGKFVCDPQQLIKPVNVNSAKLFLKYFLFFILVLVISIVLAGLFGILHDQITYSLSAEYYTKFKFYQFGFTDSLAEAVFINPRMEVAKVGWLATWWVGKWIFATVGVSHWRRYAGRLKSVGVFAYR